MIYVDTNKRSATRIVEFFGGILVVLILVAGTIMMGRGARIDTEKAVRSVSMLYLDELAARREQVVASNLQQSIDDVRSCIELMDANDLSDKAHLEAYQTRMKQLFNLERLAFVDTSGRVYTSTGMEPSSDVYAFDYRTIDEPKISILNLYSLDKKVIIAEPVDIDFNGEHFVVCFMQKDMDVMLEGVSMRSEANDATFCNIYTTKGVALSNTVLGGLAVEDNLIDAMKLAEFEDGGSYEQFCDDFAHQRRGVSSFSYNGIRETLSYVPIKGTDWLLTYLIRESIISENISSISEGTIRRSIIQSLLTVASLVGVFGFIISQNRRNARLVIEKETSEAESRVKRQELEQRLALQEQLLVKDREHERQNQMITALSSDYWSVYYIELDSGEGICYQSHADLEDGLKAGERFNYLPAVTTYANSYINEAYREEFLDFIQPDNVREGLRNNRVIS